MSRAQESRPREAAAGRNAPARPAHPERICWGCERLCPASALACGMDTVRAPHPLELFGDDWRAWAEARERQGPTGALHPDENLHK
ncbi:MAG: DUF3079 domain-containing protein [Candidatus Eremiobacterota bacterium]